jgi:hypothetical protein
MPKKLTNEEFLDKLLDLVGDEYIALSEYKGNKKKIKLKHTVCDYIWEIRVNSFLHNGARCPMCNNRARKILNHSDFIREVKIIHGDEYQIVTEYTRASDHISFLCKKHGEVYSSPQNFLRHGCGKCRREKKRKTHEEFLQEIKDLHGGSVIALDKYIDIKTKMKFECICSYQWEARPAHILRGYGCPICTRRNSSGEESLNNLLLQNKLAFTTQFTHSECKYKNVLRFDFYVEDKIIIEFDGKQHFEPVDFGGRGMEWAKIDFEERKKQDKIKNDFCKKFRIPLIRIPYWEKELELTIKAILQYFNLIDFSIDKEFSIETSLKYIIK